jgi:hypothetical protein
MNKKLVAFRELVVLVFFLVIISVFAAKLDGNTNASWFVVLTPLWFFDVIYICLVGVGVVMAIRERVYADLGFVLAFGLALSSFVVFQLLLTFKVEGVLHIPYIAVGAPLMLICAGLLVMQVYKFAVDKKKANPVRRRR